MMNFGDSKWFGAFIKKLQKILNCINHVIYTCDIVLVKICICSSIVFVWPGWWCIQKEAHVMICVKLGN